MSKEANKTVVTEFIDGLFSRGDLSAVDTYLAEDFVNHDPPLGAPADREGMRSAGALFRTAYQLRPRRSPRRSGHLARRSRRPRNRRL